jgi:hypothetical protein
MSVLSDYVEAAQDQDTLGSIVMYTVRGGVPQNLIEQQFLLCGLDSKFLPKKIQPSDAWKKATKIVDDVTYTYDASKQQRARLMVRNVTSDSIEIERHVVREIVDAKDRTLSHDVVLKLFYRFFDHSMYVRPNFDPILTPQHEIDQLQVVEQDIRTAYEHHKEHLDGNALRYIIRNYIKSLHAVPVRDGVYFVADSQADELSALQKFTRAIGSRIYTVPLLDNDDEHREMVREAFITQSEQDMYSLIKQVKDTEEKYAGKRIPKRAYEKLVEAFAATNQTKTEIEQQFGESMENASDAFGLAMTALNNLALKLEG